MNKKEIVKNCYYLESERFKDGFDGWLGIMEQDKQIPFPIKRVYYIYNLVNNEGVSRGKHAHKNLEQALFCINGACDIMVDDGEKQERIRLDKAHTGLYLGRRLWHEMRNFQNNCIILVLASDFFKADDYIRDYQKFLKYVEEYENGGKKEAEQNNVAEQKSDEPKAKKNPLFLTDLRL
jgi:oxalate decarboxylase/phosphoglucose isomerase-like protein (cupin superfamily)